MTPFFGRASQQTPNVPNHDDRQLPMGQYLPPGIPPNHIYTAPPAGYYPSHTGAHEQTTARLHPQQEHHHIMQPNSYQYQQYLSEQATHQEMRQIAREVVEEITEALYRRIAELEAQKGTKCQSCQGTSNKEDNKPPKEVQSTIIEAVQNQAKALLGVSEVREKDLQGGKYLPKKLILPIPHNASDYQPRTSEDNHELFSPDWLAGKSDIYNRRYLNAIIKSVLAQAEEATIDVPEEYRTINIIQHAAEQYFATLTDKYKGQINPEHAKKQSRKADTNKISNRKRTKSTRRLAAWPEFKKKHNIEHDLAYLIDGVYMSDEEDGPGNVSAESWKAEARKVAGAGQTVVETQRVPWRTEKLISFYYALDNESFNPSDPTVKRAKLTHVRFHGFKENESKTIPSRNSLRQQIPSYIVDQDWLHATGNLDAPLDTRSAEPEEWAGLMIDDGELDPRDLEAIQNWRAEKDSTSEGAEEHD